MKKSIDKIVLTGGPCAGKTTALVKIIEHFTGLGYLVYALPEAATLFSQAGVNFLSPDKNYYFEAEKSLLKFQIEMENTFEKLAKSSGKKSLIILDRGVMDIAAYLDANTWQALCDEFNFPLVQLRDERYDAVIHMVTAAKGAEKFYTTANNAARSEGIEQAKKLDDKLIDAWTGHPHLRIISNEGDFERKINKTVAEIASFLGEPEPLEIERKYIVELIEDIPMGTDVEITQTYLATNNDSEMRVRRRGANSNYVYFLTTKKTIAQGVRIETEEQLTPTEYLKFLALADTDRQPIQKIRKCFVWENQYFEMDTYLSPKLKEIILEIEGVRNHQEIKFPPFLKIIRDVTGVDEYNNANIALKNKY